MRVTFRPGSVILNAFRKGQPWQLRVAFRPGSVILARPTGIQSAQVAGCFQGGIGYSIIELLIQAIPLRVAFRAGSVILTIAKGADRGMLRVAFRAGSVILVRAGAGVPVRCGLLSGRDRLFSPAS